MFVPLNIVLYNVFGQGPNIFGTEPWYFYIVNGFLNFNVLFLLALASGVLAVRIFCRASIWTRKKISDGDSILL